jgi:cell division transport system permease protein
MLLDFALPEHERKLIPEGRLSGAMPWVVAIMLFLTLLGAASGLFLLEASRQGGNDLARQLTVQIIEADPALRVAKRVAVTRELSGVSGVIDVKPVPDAQVRALLEPWLGSAVVDADIPVPALIDLNMQAPPTPAQLKHLADRVNARAPGSRIESHATWMAPFFDLMRALLLLISGILFLLLVATSATVVLAVRAALNTHRETIEIMHMMGGTDRQAARLFQRRMALDALFGGVIGFVAAAAVIVLLGGRFAQLEPGLLSGASFPVYGWIVLALIPLAVTGIAMLMARMTVISALKKML